MKRIAAVLALIVGSQGCVGMLHKDDQGYYTNESVAAAMAIPVVVAAGVGLLVYAGRASDSDKTSTPDVHVPASSFPLPEEH